MKFCEEMGGVGGIPDLRFSEIQAWTMEPTKTNCQAITTAKTHLDRGESCHKCGQKVVWPAGFRGKPWCLKCQHRWRIFDEEPREGSEVLLIFAKVLVITLVVIAFLALVILWWQANDGGAYNAGYEAGQHGAFIEMGGGANSTQWFQGFQDGAQERKRSQ